MCHHLMGVFLVVAQVAHVRQLGVPHLVVAFDSKVEQACREKSILFHRDDEGTGQGCEPSSISGCNRLEIKCLKECHQSHIVSISYITWLISCIT